MVNKFNFPDSNQIKKDYKKEKNKEQIILWIELPKISEDNSIREEVNFKTLELIKTIKDEFNNWSIKVKKFEINTWEEYEIKLYIENNHRFSLVSIAEILSNNKLVVTNQNIDYLEFDLEKLDDNKIALSGKAKLNFVWTEGKKFGVGFGGTLLLVLLLVLSNKIYIKKQNQEV